MYKLSCKDLGEESCTFGVKAESMDEVAGKMMEHAKMVHPDKWQEMNDKMSKEEMTSMMKSKMQKE